MKIVARSFVLALFYLLVMIGVDSLFHVYTVNIDLLLKLAILFLFLFIGHLLIHLLSNLSEKIDIQNTEEEK